MWKQRVICLPCCFLVSCHAAQLDQIPPYGEAAPGQANSGCGTETDFTMMLIRSRAYYRTGLFELSDSERVSRILEHRDVIKDICTVALLQAILLKLEENLIYQADAFESLMSQYALYLHEAIRQGRIRQEDMEVWPLDEGIQRVRNISQALSEKRPLSTAMVMNYCQVTDRFGASHELDWLAEPFFAEAAEGGLLAETDLYIYQVDWPWCKPLQEGILRKLRRVVRRLHVVPYAGGPRREEQTAYFKYISDHWDNLPDFTIFVHPDADEHQGAAFLALRRALSLINTQSQFAYDALGYYPLAQQMVVEPRRTWGPGFAPKWRRFWRRVFGHPWDILGHKPPRCKWERHAGHYLAAHAEAGQRQTLPAAKAACALLEEDCAGVTCLTPFDPLEADSALPLPQDRFGQRSCTARVGAEGLISSPEPSEVSYLKTCAAEGQSAHAADFTEDSETGATYQKAEGTFLFGYAEEDEVSRGEADARRRCDELGDACTGYTCAASIQVSPSTTKKGYAEAQQAQSCTVRSGRELIRSPSNELTYLKAMLHSAVARKGDKADASGDFQFYTGSQSIVRKDRLQWWPLEEIQTFAADGIWCSDTTGLFEAVWHRMFGEPLSQHPRGHDPALQACHALPVSPGFRIHAWLLLGNMFSHFCLLWFSGGNPHLTAKKYFVAPLPRSTKHRGVPYR
ncbi:unnamed protein product [Effrenium voratum]|nr:unnamed protein product [Effrenium voratum]